MSGNIKEESLVCTILKMGWANIFLEDKEFKVLICGDRNWDDQRFINKFVEKLPKGTTIIEIQMTTL